MAKHAAPSHKTSATTHSDGPTSIMNAFDGMSTWSALGIVMGLAALMIATVYRTFLFGDAVLLYTDIGSDAVNIFYPLWYQQAKLWAQHGALHGFSLETVMGMPTSINLWDPFQWIIISGGPEAIPQRVVVAEILKSLLTAAFAFGTFRMMGLRNVTSTVGALCFAFSGYIALGAGAWYVHSAEVVLIAVALWSSEYATNGRRFWFVISPLMFAFIAQNGGYLTIYLTAAVIVYALIRALQSDQLKPALRGSAMAIGSLAVGLLISYSAITGMITSLTQSGRAEALNTVEGGLMSLKKDRSITQLVERAELTKVVQRAYSINALGIGNDYRGSTAGGDNYLEGPLLYFGLPMLLFFPLYGLGRSRREKLVWGAMLAAVLMMLIFPWFRYAFWGFKLDYFREFTMLIGAFLLLLAMRGLDGLVSIRSDAQRIWVPATALVMVVLPFVIAKPASLLDPSQRTVSVVLMLGLGTCATAYAFQRRPVMLLGLLALTMVDLSLNAHSTVTKRSLLSETDIRNGKLYADASVQALDWIKRQDADLYRTVKYSQSGPAIHPSINDAMVQGFNGLMGYSSFHNKYYLKFMTELGCADLARPDEAKWVSRIMARPFLASALGARYFVTKGAPLGFIPEVFPVVHTVQDQFVQRSSVTLPLLVAYDRVLSPEQFRTFDQGKMDLMLYKTVVLEAPEASAANLTPYDLSQDSSGVLPIDFVTASEQRRAAMDVKATTTANGLTAEVDLKSASMVVISVPYDPTLQVTIDGQPAKTMIANFGFVGVMMSNGKHKVELSY